MAGSRRAGDKLKDALRGIGKWSIELIKRTDKATGLDFLPRRWVVERTLTWLNRNRRLATRYDETADSYLGFIHIVSIRLGMRQFVNAS